MVNSQLNLHPESMSIEEATPYSFHQINKSLQIQSRSIFGQAIVNLESLGFYLIVKISINLKMSNPFPTSP